MIDILSTTQVVLREAGFSTYLTSIDRLSIVCFEDDVVTGFSYIFEDPESMLKKWKSIETLFLTNYAPSLRAAGEKA